MHFLFALPLALLPAFIIAAPANLLPRDTSSVCTYHIYYAQSGYPYINSYDVSLDLYAPCTDPKTQGKKLDFVQGVSSKHHWGDMTTLDAYCWSATQLEGKFCITPSAPVNRVNNNWVLTFQVGNGTSFSSPEPADCPIQKRANTDSTPGPFGMSVGCLDGGGQDGIAQDGSDVSIDGSFACTGTLT